MSKPAKASSRALDTKSPPTKPVPGENRDYIMEGPNPVTWVHIFGTAIHLQLPPKRREMILGRSSKADLIVQSPYMSRKHCKIERGFDCIRVTDLSMNGIGVDEQRLQTPREFRPGQTFLTGGGITFLALNDAMRAAYPVLCDLIGWERSEDLIPIDGKFSKPSNAIVWGVGNEAIVIVGPTGSDHHRLAETIHGFSSRATRDIVWLRDPPATRSEQKALLVRAARSTLVFTIDDRTTVLDRDFRSALFSPSYRVRVIVCAPSMDRVIRVLGPDHSLVHCLTLRPLGYRDDEIEILLDRQLEERGSLLRTAALTDHNRAAIRKFGWEEKDRKNWDSLRYVADSLAAIHAAGSVRKLAKTVGVARQSLQSWYNDTMGLTAPLTVSGSEHE